MTSSINRFAAGITQEFEAAAKSDNIITPKMSFCSYALHVICACALGVDLEDDKEKREEFYRNLQGLFNHKFNVCLIIAVIIPHADKLLKRCDIGPFPKKTVKFIIDEITQLVNKRRTNPELRMDDFLQLLTDASSGQSGSKKELSTEEVNAQGFSFVMASYETIAACLQFISYELALNQHVQDKLKSEITNIVGEDEPTYEHLKDLKYTGNVINEALRKYPPLGRMSRYCSESTTIEGVQIPKGSSVVIPIYHIHHEPRFYPNPEDFRPERFNPDSECKVDPVMFLPFGGGPRTCVGIKFAMMQIKIILIHLMRKVRFVPCKETEPSPPQFQKSTPVLHTVKPIKLQVVLDLC